MAAVDVEDDGVTVICLTPGEADELADVLIGGRPFVTYGSPDKGWNLGQQILYERDRGDRRGDYIEGCVACRGRKGRARKRDKTQPYYKGGDR